MILGLSTFTWVHTALSLVGLIAGLVVVIGLVTASRLDRWTALYLASTVAASATGFGFKVESFGASHWVGVVSLVTLLVAQGIALVIFVGLAPAATGKFHPG